MNYCIYKLTNSVNGKVYIGTTCQALKDRWRNGKAYKGTELGDDISEVGWSSFFKEVLVDGLSQGDAIQQEKNTSNCSILLMMDTTHRLAEKYRQIKKSKV